MKGDKLQISSGKLKKQDKAVILKAVHEVADGKTLTGMYRDLGLVREKKAAVHHSIKAKKLSPEEELDLRKNADAEAWGGFEMHFEHNIDFTLHDDLVVQARIAVLDKISSAYKRWTATPKAKRDPKAILDYLQTK